MNKLSLSLLIFCFVQLSAFGQQRPFFDYESLFIKIEESLKKGETRALRDLGTLLDVSDFHQQALDLLDENVIFPKDIIPLDISLNKETFLKFFYEHEKDILFSETAKVFYFPPLDRISMDFRTMPTGTDQVEDPSNQLRHESAKLLSALAKGSYDIVIEQVHKIGNIRSSEAFSFLKGLLEEKQILRAKSSHKSILFESLTKQIAKDHSQSSLELILKLVQEEYVSTLKAQKYLTGLTNVNFSMTEDPQLIYGFYTNLMDSLGNLDQVREFGYSRYFSFSKDFFAEPVDYYGKILSEVEDLPWIASNALTDLVKSGHPRALMHIAANIYKNRTRKNEEYSVDISKQLNALEKLSGIRVGIKDETNTYNFGDPTDDLNFQRGIFLYWLNHWQDYTWDENNLEFVNKKQAAEQEQSYEKLFRRLGSKKDSIAIAAYQQLSEGNPEKITDLSEKYRQLLRNYNKRLPSFKFYFLEALSRFTEYCRDHGIQYIASGDISAQLAELENIQSEVKRIELENKIINSLSLENVSIIEYWSALRESDKEANYSVGRILDKFYSKNWNFLISDNEHIRHYLKKSYLFEQIGVIGVCNSYLKKFDLKDTDLLKKLEDILKVESDSEIANQLEQIIDRPEVDESYGLDAFIEDPTSFGGRDIKLLPPATEDEALQLAQVLRSAEDMEAIKKLFFYLRLNPNTTIVPFLYQMIDDERVMGMKDGIQVTIGENLVSILERIYGYSYPTPEGEVYNRIAWKSMWMQDSLNYKSWGVNFLVKDISILEQKDTLEIEEINQITNSLFYDPMLKERCIKLLAKVHPVKDIRKFQIEPKLSIATDLRFFEGFRFTYKELDDIPKLFDVANPKKMVNFLIRESEEFSVEDLGSFYNKLFTLDWFQQYVNGDQMEPHTASRIARILKEYLSQSDFISEFEEQSTNLHIAQMNNIGKPLIERLGYALENEMDEGSKYKIQQSIIAGIAYEEIGTIISNLDQLSNPNQKDPIEFLRKDFGLPIFEITNSKKFVSDHSKLSEKEFYLKALKDFGIEIHAGKKLNFEKIYDILQFDIVTPFVGGGGAKRDYYVYGVIKVLELHFGTTLDFHEKLNENQSFYTFTSSKRAKAWIKYLKENGHIDQTIKSPPSFNQPRELAIQ